VDASIVNRDALAEIIAGEVKKHLRVCGFNEDGSVAQHWFSPKQAAKYCGCARGLINTLTTSGTLKKYPLGGKTVYARADLDTAIRSGVFDKARDRAKAKAAAASVEARRKKREAAAASQEAA
jgi:hypothetical protein